MTDNKQLTVEELFSLRGEEFSLIDLRDETNTAYGMLPGAIALRGEALQNYLSSLPENKKAILYCTRGETSLEVLSEVLPFHENTYSLQGGFFAYLTYRMSHEEETERKEAERKEAERKKAVKKEAEKKEVERAKQTEEDQTESGEKKETQKEANIETENEIESGSEIEPEGQIKPNIKKKKSPAEETPCERAERSIRKTYHKQLFTPFAKACRDYELLAPGDKVAVCISGGKDSMLMAKLFQELKRHRKFPFELIFLVMDPGYNPLNRQLIEYNAKRLEIPVHIFESTIFDAVYTVDKNPCYLCARMRRGYLYAKAKELGCNKIALGHHYDDVIETILMGMLYGAQVQSMMPKLHSIHFPGMELIRPMYLIREDDIKRWRDYNSLTFLQCACHFTETCSSCDSEGQSASKRLEVKNLIAQLKKTNPYVEANIFRSMENVCLDTCLGYKQRGERHSFLEDYDSRRGEEE